MSDPAAKLPGWLRVGCVPFLNARPLIQFFPSEQVVFEHPRILSDSLYEGKVDVALVPVVEAMRRPGYRVVDGWGIAAHGSVESVILAHQVPLKELRSIALDQTSLTSVHLLRVLVEFSLGLTPQWREEGQPADAQLWIGDRARDFRRQHPQAAIWDLAGAWSEWTSLPFVFAVWAIRPGLRRRLEWLPAFCALCERGWAMRVHCAETPEDVNYLTRCIHYVLGEQEKKGLTRFFQEIKRLPETGPWYSPEWVSPSSAVMG